MSICRHSTAGDFLRRAQPWLQLAEAENNLVLGIARRSSRIPATDTADSYWATVEFDDMVAGAAFRTFPHNLALTQLPTDAVSLLVADVWQRYTSIPGLSGPREAAAQSADVWCARSGERWREHLNLRIHKLTEVAALPNRASGCLRPGTDADLTLATAWMSRFIDDVHATHIAPTLGEQLVRARQLFFWDDGGPRSMVGSSRDTPRGACINAVYTPPEHRRRGYATAAVVALSQTLLNSGKQFCCLYTDLANPTSNAIYRRIGYAPIQDAIEIEFA
jgi:predicted GNAT family acetyltransferase